MRSLSAPLVALAVVAALLMCAPTAAAATHNVNGTVGTSFSQSTGYGGGEHIGLWVGGQSGGLSFSSSSGVISGTPTAAGVYTLQVFYQIPLTENLRETYVITIAAPQIVSISSAQASVSLVAGGSFSYNVVTSPSDATISVTGAPWLQVSGHTVSGTPVVGVYDITITASKAGYTSATQTFRLTVVPQLEFITVPTADMIVYVVG